MQLCCDMHYVKIMNEIVNKMCSLSNNKPARNLPIHKCNFDVIVKILSYLPIEISYDDILHELFPNLTDNDIYELGRIRSNPRLILKELVTDTDELIIMMAATDTVLSGSRAANHFYPGSCITDSDWDFYCSNDIFKRMFFTSWLQDKLDLASPSIITHSNREYHSYVHMNILNIEKQSCASKIQLIWKISSQPIDIILEFSESICKCAITGFECFSLDSYISKYYIFSTDTISTEARREKYRSRGFKLISSKDKQKYSSIPYNKRNPVKVRSLYDIDSFYVNYRRFKDTVKDTVIHESKNIIRINDAHESLVWTENRICYNNRYKILHGPKQIIGLIFDVAQLALDKLIYFLISQNYLRIEKVMGNSNTDIPHISDNNTEYYLGYVTEHSHENHHIYYVFGRIHNNVSTLPYLLQRHVKWLNNEPFTIDYHTRKHDCKQYTSCYHISKRDYLELYRSIKHHLLKGNKSIENYIYKLTT